MVKVSGDTPILRGRRGVRLPRWFIVVSRPEPIVVLRMRAKPDRTVCGLGAHDCDIAVTNVGSVSVHFGGRVAPTPEHWRLSHSLDARHSRPQVVTLWQLRTRRA